MFLASLCPFLNSDFSKLSCSNSPRNMLITKANFIVYVSLVLSVWVTELEDGRSIVSNKQKHLRRPC